MCRSLSFFDEIVLGIDLLIPPVYLGFILKRLAEWILLKCRNVLWIFKKATLPVGLIRD